MVAAPNADIAISRGEAGENASSLLDDLCPASQLGSDAQCPWLHVWLVSSQEANACDELARSACCIEWQCVGGISIDADALESPE